jgi:methylmalonyl-CoA mutase cobalamin-binding subunit
VQLDDAGLQVRAACSGEDGHDESMTAAGHLLRRMGGGVLEDAQRQEAAKAVWIDL